MEYMVTFWQDGNRGLLPPNDSTSVMVHSLEALRVIVASGASIRVAWGLRWDHGMYYSQKGGAHGGEATTESLRDLL